MTQQLDFETYDRMVGAIYAAGHDPTRWQDALDQIDAFVDGAYLSIHGHDMRTGENLGTLTTRFSPDALQDYVEHYAFANPHPGAILSDRPMEILASEDRISRDEMRRTEFYNDFLAPQEDIGTGGGGALVHDGERLLIVGCQIRFRDEDTVLPRMLDTFRRLAPHLRRAFEMQRSLHGLRALTHGETAGGRAAVALDRAGRVLHATDAADAMLTAGDRIARRRDGTLCLQDTALQRWLMATLRRYADGRVGSTPDLRPLDQGTVRLEPVPEMEDGIARIATAIDPRRPVAILFLTCEAPQDWTRARVALRRVYGLTEAEAAVACGIAAGQDAAEIAVSRGVSVETVRSQIQAAFVATGCTKQVALAAAVRRLLH